MSDHLADPTVLVPMNAADPVEPPPALVELLHPHRVVVLGYYPVPDQASPEQLEAEHGETAVETVENAVSHFATPEGTVDSLVVFTRDRQTTIDRIADEYDCDAVLSGGSMGEQLNRVFIPLKGDANLERIVTFVGALLADTDAEVTLFNVVDDEDEASAGEFLLRGAADRLAEDGIDRSRIEWTQERARSPSTAIVSAATDADLIVVGESEPSLRGRILGDVTDRIMSESTHPLLVVRTL